MNRYTQSFRIILILLLLQTHHALSQTILPKPDHTVILILENHSFNQIIGSSAAPYINSLAYDTASVLFTASYAVAHPSQPNYLVLYSGSTQGVTDDAIPSGNPFTTPNLGSQLITAGKTFVTYSEDLPAEGFNGETSGYYARRHNPVTNWMGNGVNQVPGATNQPFTAFPTDFTLLPTVCFVVPNVQNDMHNGTNSVAITTGDNWVSANMNSYIQWAKKNNSLFILTFDENDNSGSNQVLTILTGQNIVPGIFTTGINHYSILHTIEKMYEVPLIGDSVNNPPIDLSWKTFLPDNKVTGEGVYPNPARRFIYVVQSGSPDAKAEIYSLKGELILTQPLASNKTFINIEGVRNGVYLVKINTKEGVTVRKLIKN